MEIKSYRQYIDTGKDKIDELDNYRRQLIAQCKQLQKYIDSAYDYSVIDIDIDDIGYELLYAPDDEKYAEWSDRTSDAEIDRAYDIYERQNAAYSEVADIADILDDIKYLIKKAEDKLAWVDGE